MEKAGLIGLVRMRYIESDDKFSMRGQKLIEALKRDQEEGLVPFFVSAFSHIFYRNVLKIRVKYQEQLINMFRRFARL